MKTIKLTPEADATISRWTSEWLELGRSTMPADFEVAETGIASLYERIGLKRPYFVRLSSPFAAEVYIKMYCRHGAADRGRDC